MLLSPSVRRRAPSLTPMIDVVFLLLVFFMLSARFGLEVEIELPLSAASRDAYQGPPRLIDITPQMVRLNGVEMPSEDLLPSLAPLMLSHDDIIVLRPRQDADLQRVVELMELLTGAGYETLVLVQ